MGKIVFVLIAVVVVLAISAVNGGKLSCANGLEGPNPDTMNAIVTKCKDPNVWGTDAGKKNPDCDQLCVAEVLGYLSPDGKVSLDMYFKWIEADFSPKNQEFAKNHIKDCYEKYGSKIDYSDQTCTEMKKFDTCGWSMVPNLKC